MSVEDKKDQQQKIDDLEINDELIEKIKNNKELMKKLKEETKKKKQNTTRRVNIFKGISAMPYRGSKWKFRHQINDGLNGIKFEAEMAKLENAIENQDCEENAIDLFQDLNPRG